MNNVLMGRTKNEDHVLVIPDPLLFDILTGDKTIEVQELPLLDPDVGHLRGWFKYGENIEEDKWFTLLDDERLYEGKTIEIPIAGHPIPIVIHKDLIPLRLRKAEFNSIAYRVFVDPLLFGIKKRFELLEGYGFTIMRLFQIV
jgi:hypothetical protein